MTIYYASLFAIAIAAVALRIKLDWYPRRSRKQANYHQLPGAPITIDNVEV